MLAYSKLYALYHDRVVEATRKWGRCWTSSWSCCGSARWQVKVY